MGDHQTSMSGIKRSGKSRGAVRGHRFGVDSEILLDYRAARMQIYLPAYLWVLEHRLHAELEQLREQLREQLTIKPLVLLDYETNADVNNLRKPLSHAALIKHYLQDAWPV